MVTIESTVGLRQRKPVVMLVYRTCRPTPRLAAALLDEGHSVLERQVTDGQGLEGDYDVSVVVALVDPVDPPERQVLHYVASARPQAMLLVMAPSDSDATQSAAFDCGAVCCLRADRTPAIIAAQVTALVRIASNSRGAGPGDTTLGDIAIDLGRRQVRVGGRPVALTRGEFDILAVLAAHVGRVLTSQDILSLAGQPAMSVPQARDIVKAHVCRLRQKLGLPADESSILQTVRGVGYVLERRETGPRDAARVDAGASSRHLVRELVPA
jgi:DNA-binding response OmpR family regulator